MANSTPSRTRKRAGNAVTMSDVARLAGVSTMTVSNVINQKPSVGPQVREAVMEAIRELDYQPNTAARALASATRHRIGLLYRDEESALLSAMLIGALRATSRLGIQLILRPFSDENPLDAARAFAANIDGLILPPPLCEAASAARLPAELGIPIVGLAPGAELPNMPAVRIHDEQAAFEMTRYLLGLGHKRIGFVRLPMSLSGESRYRGYCRALEEAGVELHEELVWQARPTFSEALSLAEKVLARRDRPSAIFAGNDDMAAAFINVAHRLDLHVPEDLSIVGFDDTPIAVKIWPTLTTVRQPLAEIAERAVDRLVAMIRDPDADDHWTEYVDFTLTFRDSVQPPHA